MQARLWTGKYWNILSAILLRYEVVLMFFTQEWAVLFIQMQLCNQTLKQWLDVRNTSSNSSVDVSQSMYIFAQVIKGIEFIHSKGIVHHDIKVLPALPNRLIISSNLLNIFGN